MADFRIRVIIDPSNAVSGSRKVDRSLQALERRAARITTVLGQALGFVGIAAGIKEIVRLTDTLTNMQNRLKLVTTGTKNLNAVTSELFKIAIRTRTSFEGTATIFSRTALSVKNLGLTQRETLEFTESLNKAIVLSGVTAQEANAGLIQLSQGMASNTLRGDELRSVLEQLPKVADVIAKQMKITRGELRLFGAQGKISAETVIEAFKNAADELDAAFANTVPTISQSFVVLQTKIIQFLGELDKASNGTNILSKAIIGLANNLDVVAGAFAIAASVIAVVFVKKGVNVAIIAVRTLTAAIAANPFGALIILIIAAVTAMDQFGDKVKLTEDGLATVADFGVVAFDAIQTAIQQVINQIDNFIFAINEIAKEFGFAEILNAEIIQLARQFELSFGNIVRFAAFVADKVIGFLTGINDAVIAVAKKLPDILIGVLNKFTDSLKTQLENTFNVVIITFNEFASKFNFDPVDLIKFERAESTVRTGFGDLGGIAADAFDTAFSRTTFADKIGELIDLAEGRAKALKPPEVDGDDGLDKRGERVSGLPAALKQQLELLAKEQIALQKSGKERAIQNELLKIEQKLRSANVQLTDPQRQQLELTIRTTQRLRDQASALDELQGPQQDLIDRQENLNALFGAGRITTDELTAALFDLRLEQAAINAEADEGNFAAGFLLSIEQMLEATRNFKTEAGGLMGEFFSQTTAGFGDAIANSIIFGESFSEAIGNVAKRALADLISGFVQLGIQYLLNAAIARTLGATATAAGVTEAGILATAWATPAALASLASFGANSVPANAAIVGTVALTQGLAQVQGLKDGGTVRGPGGPRSDAVPAMLSNGEFVVNAKSAARFRPQLESINNPAAFAHGGFAGEIQDAQDASVDAATGAGSSAPTIINVLDPAIIGDFLDTPEGEDVIINVMRRNSSRIQNSQR